MAALALLVTLGALGCHPGEGRERVPDAAAALLSAVTAAGSEQEPAASSEEKVVYYRYVDASGSIRFVKRPDEVPKSQREGARIEWKAEPRTGKEARPTTSRLGSLSRSLANRFASAGARAPGAARAARPDVVLYTTSWCGWCRKTIAHLDRHGVLYDNRDIERDQQAYEDLKRKTGSTGVPVIEIDGELIRGFDRERIDQLLGL